MTTGSTSMPRREMAVMDKRTNVDLIKIYNRSIMGLYIGVLALLICVLLSAFASIKIFESSLKAKLIWLSGLLFLALFVIFQALKIFKLSGLNCPKCNTDLRLQKIRTVQEIDHDRKESTGFITSIYDKCPNCGENCETLLNEKFGLS